MVSGFKFFNFGLLTLTFNSLLAFPGGPRYSLNLFFHCISKKDKFTLSGVEGLLSLTQINFSNKTFLSKNTPLTPLKRGVNRGIF